jgi:hypothetical protein
MTDDLGTILTQISEQLQNLDLRLLELERERTEANVLLFNGITVARAAVDAERGERIEADAALEAKDAALEAKDAALEAKDAALEAKDAALDTRISDEGMEKFNAYLDACSRLQSLEKACGFFDNEPAAPAWPPRRPQPVSVVLVPVVPGDDCYEDGMRP